MGKVIAIGGMTNEINDIKTICGAIINECKKENPRLLYVPTANNDHPDYSEFMTNFFEKNYSCDVDTLWLINKVIDENQTREKILNTDIVFVEGGNLLLLLEIWKRYGIDRIMKQAFDSGIIMSGISAGANCWFEESFSDSIPGKEFSFVKGLSFVKGCICPHYNDNRRKTCFNYEIRNRNDLPSIAFGIEENNAIIIDNGDIKKISESNTENGIYIFNIDNNIGEK